jgi:four helix bundle protein
MANIEVNRPLKEHTLAFATTGEQFVAGLARNEAARAIGRQMLKSGTSIDTIDREANRAELSDEFVHKTALVVKEASETDHWLELCNRVDLGDVQQRTALNQEARKQCAFFTTANRKAESR